MYFPIWLVPEFLSSTCPFEVFVKLSFGPWK